MRKSTLIVAVVASAACVVAAGQASIAGSHGATNAGHSGATVTQKHYGTDVSSPAKKKFKAYATPVAKYTGKSCAIDLSSIPDGTAVSSVTGCGTTVGLSGSWLKVSVPNFWASWSCPPASESCTPNGLWSNGQFSATLDFGKKVKTGGFELEPDAFQVDTVSVDFYSGPNGTGKIVGNVTLMPNGQSGALLFGGKSKKGFQSAVINDQSSDDFAIAQVRV